MGIHGGELHPDSAVYRYGNAAAARDRKNCCEGYVWMTLPKPIAVRIHPIS